MTNSVLSIDAPHNQTSGIGCVDCHGHKGQGREEGKYSREDVDCFSCHDDVTAPEVSRHESDNFGGWSRDCVDCHDAHSQDQLSWGVSDLYLVTGVYYGFTGHPGNYTTTFSIQNYTVHDPDWSDPGDWSEKNGPGRGLIFVADTDDPDVTFEVLEAGSDYITVQGNVDEIPSYLNDLNWEDGFGLIYGQMLKSTVTGYGGARDVKLFNPGQFAHNDGLSSGDDSTPDGVCQVCHSLTHYWTAGGESGEHYSGEDCIRCHSHRANFLHGGDGDDCADCHGHSGAHAVHTVLNSRGPNPPLTCGACHDIDNYPLFGEPGAAETLEETMVCDDCHSPDGPFDGVTEGKTNWSSGSQVSCQGCHDTGNSTIQGVSAPPAAGDNSTWGYFVSGHGGRHGFITCVDCHDVNKTHIDGEPDTYSFNSNYYAPAESGRAYADGYRLREISGEAPLMIPSNYYITFGYDAQLMKETAFRLCFECHLSDNVFDNIPGNGLKTNFKATPPNPPRNYSYAWGSGESTNEHVAHILNYVGPFADSDWDVNTSGPGGQNGRDTMTTCTSCHNVHGASGTHGSTNEAMIRDGVLVERNGYGFSYVIEDTAAGGYPWVTSQYANKMNSVGAVFRNNTGDMCGGSLCHDDPDPPPASSYDASGSAWGTYLEYYRPYHNVFACGPCHGSGTSTSATCEDNISSLEPLHPFKKKNSSSDHFTGY